ncbi:hypothetical protein OROHE_016251 [Orobanche hederae]
MSHLVDHNTWLPPEQHEDEHEWMDLRQETIVDHHPRFEAALGRRWTVDDTLSILERLDRDVASRGDDDLSDRYNSHFLDVITDDGDNMLERVVRQYIDFLRTSGEVAPDWTEDDTGVLADDVVLELENYLQSMYSSPGDDRGGGGGGGLSEDIMSEETMSKCLKTRTCDEGVVRDDEKALEICIVCQDSLRCEEKETIGTLGCGHEYHVDCIKQWLRKNNICPLCRAKALHEEDDCMVEM